MALEQPDGTIVYVTPESEAKKPEKKEPKKDDTASTAKAAESR